MSARDALTRSLAERCARASGWRWLPGCASTDGLRFLGPPDALLNREWILRRPPPIPDLADPPTLGALRELVRIAWRDPGAHTLPVFVGEKRHWECSAGPYRYPGATEAAALVLALEGAGDYPNKTEHVRGPS